MWTKYIIFVVNCSLLKIAATCLLVNVEVDD